MRLVSLQEFSVGFVDIKMLGIPVCRHSIFEVIILMITFVFVYFDILSTVQFLWILLQLKHNPLQAFLFLITNRAVVYTQGTV